MRNKVIVIVAIIFYATLAFSCWFYLDHAVSSATTLLQDKKQTLSALKEENKKLQSDYEDYLSNITKQSYRFDNNKIIDDKKLLEKICKLSFDYDSSEVYDKNRQEVLTYLKRFSFMNDVFFENKKVHAKNRKKSNIIDDIGVMKKLKSVDVYYMRKRDKRYRYLIRVISTPYFGSDIKHESVLHKQQFLIISEINDSKIVKFDAEECEVL